MTLVSQTGRGMESMRPSALRKSTRAASVATLALLVGLTACNNDYTLSYVYAPSVALTTGLINAYGVDNQTGSLRLLQDSPIPSGGRKPVAIVATPPDKTKIQAIYVANHDDSTIVEFHIGTDGKIYPQNTYNTTGASESSGIQMSGSFPVAMAITPDGNFLYVAYTYQQGYTPASPGPGGITIFQINADRSLQLPAPPPPAPQLTAGQYAPQDFPIGRAPVAIAVSSKPLADGKTNVVYVVAQDASATNPATTQSSDQTLNLFAFTADATTGSLSLIPGETINGGNVPSSGFPTGASPAGLIEDASGTHLYVTDGIGNQVIAYSIDPATGIPSLIQGGTAATGAQPMGMAIDPTGTYLYVANYTSGTVGEYTFDANGAPVASTTAASTLAGSGTTCVAVEPSHGVYLYASGYLSNTITGEQIIPADGSLKPIINSPYLATTLPTCAVSVPRFQ